MYVINNHRQTNMTAHMFEPTIADSIPMGPPDTDRNIIEVNAHFPIIYFKLGRLYSQLGTCKNEIITARDTTIGCDFMSITPCY